MTPDTPVKESLGEVLNAVASTIAKENSKAIDALREDKEHRHHMANVSQQAFDLATINRTRIETLEAKVTAVLGDGTGETGALARMSDRQRETQQDVAEVKIDVRQIKDTLTELRAIGENSKSALSGGKALITSLTALGTLLTVCAAIGGFILWLSHR